MRRPGSLVASYEKHKFGAQVLRRLRAARVGAGDKACTKANTQRNQRQAISKVG